MATYDVSSHGLLSAEAEDLSSQHPSAFTELTDAAETLLGVTSGTPTDHQSTEKTAVVYQVNHMVAHKPEAEILSAKSIDMRSWSYRESVPTISPMAEDLLGEAGTADAQDEYDVLTSFR